jgi:N-acetylmuramoyl-L-alanine amidase
MCIISVRLFAWSLIFREGGAFFLSNQKVPRITNLWSKVADGEKGQWLSNLFIESTRPFEYTYGRNDDKTIFIRSKNTILNMPEGKITINDGIVREALLKQDAQDTVFEFRLEQPAEFHLETFDLFPFRLQLAINRAALSKVFAGKTIIIDPAHGGNDTGGRGQVSLLEKDVVMPIAHNLEKLLKRAGANAVLTRQGDEDVPQEVRCQLARRENADVYISLHTFSSTDREVSGAAAKHPVNSKAGLALATYVQEELLKKIKVKDRGIAEELEDVLPADIPAAKVEVVTITNIVEEVSLRGLTFQERAAEGVFNGIRNYFAVNQADLKVNK